MVWGRADKDAGELRSCRRWWGEEAGELLWVHEKVLSRGGMVVATSEIRRLCNCMDWHSVGGELRDIGSLFERRWGGSGYKFVCMW